jgi:hypothetical protein
VEWSLFPRAVPECTGKAGAARDIKRVRVMQKKRGTGVNMMGLESAQKRRRLTLKLCVNKFNASGKQAQSSRFFELRNERCSSLSVFGVK